MHFPEIDYVADVISRCPDETVIIGMVTLLGVVYIGCEVGRAYLRGKSRREWREKNHIKPLDKR